MEKDVGSDEVELLDAEEARKYRRLSATINFMALDRPDLQFAASVLGRDMSRPTGRSMAKLKKVGRYLVKHPKVVYKYPHVDAASVSEAVHATGMAIPAGVPQNFGAI